MPHKTLVILPSLGATLSPDGGLRLTGKFISGVRMIVEQWDGPVEVLIQKDEANHSGNLDDVWVRPEDLLFRVTVADFHSPEAKAVIARAAVVHGGADHRLNHMPAWCAALGVQ